MSFDRAHQDILVEMEVRTPNNSPRSWKAEAALRRAQRRTIRDALERLCARPRLPVQVRLVRVASRRLDSDNLAGAFKSIRDEIARWLHGLPFEEVMFVRGMPRTRVLRAPDGARDGVHWRYGQLPAPKGQRGYQAARIVIEELSAGDRA